MYETIAVIALVVVASALSYKRGQFVGRVEGIVHSQVMSEIGLAVYKSANEVREREDLSEEEMQKLFEELVQKELDEMEK